ncbi:MAG: type II toxin-antitoxin system Phd/YefM family antitoxin [Dehalococcoidia bacterium]
MERKIGAFDARRQFGKILNEVVAKGDRYVVERHGEPIAAVVPIRWYEQWMRERHAFFDRMEAIGKAANMSEDEAMALALEAQQAVRAERRRSRS